MAETLGRLLTDLGERSDYDAAAQCSRCGYCEQACPTYVATGREAQSPRGRNQILRLMLEGKLDDPAAAEEALSTCLLCGACTTACYAKVAVPDLVLEGRRMLRPETHWLVKRACRMLASNPRGFARLLKLGYALKRLGLSRLGRPILRALGLGALAEMDEHVDAVPKKIFDELFDSRHRPEGTNWRYFAACGPRYLYPNVAEATWSAVTRLEGSGRFLRNSCCGLLANNYGDLEDARALAQRNIATAEASGDAPIVADCSSCAAFLKTYPQLFLKPGQAGWRQRAERFSSRVRDAVEIYDKSASDLPLGPGAGAAAWHDSCRALNGEGLKDAPRRVVKAVAGGDAREMPGADQCCGGAGAFAFVHPELSDELLRKKIAGAASAQLRTVVASSTSCLIQLARGLRKYYPDAEVVHISEYVARALEQRHGA
jgi:glycolate oxidase iron-sulfur subunit